jgi:hypothetical protein
MEVTMKKAETETTETAPEPHAPPCDWCLAILTGVVIMFGTGNLAVLLLLLR